MPQSRYREGQTRTCPYCGQASTFSLRTPVPGTGKVEGPSGDQGASPEYRPGWTCENRNCWKRYDVEA